MCTRSLGIAIGRERNSAYGIEIPRVEQTHSHMATRALLPATPIRNPPWIPVGRLSTIPQPSTQGCVTNRTFATV